MVIHKTDEQIQQDVADELFWNPMLNTAEVRASVKDGIVILVGQVDSYAKKIEAEMSAKRIKGVRGVVEDIIVRPPRSEVFDDAHIVDAVCKALQWNADIPEENIRVEAVDGKITLEGEVDWGFQRTRVAQVAAKITGVKSVLNLITVKPRIDRNIPKDKIVKAFERSADIEAENITVDLEGNVIKLNGVARTWTERNEAERTAWNAPGVASVENYISIE